MTIKKRFKFSGYQRDELRRQGVTDKHLARLESACRAAQGWFDPAVRPPTATELRAAVRFGRELSSSLHRWFGALPGALEPSLHSRGVDVQELCEQLETLQRACDAELKALVGYKSTGKAPTEPVALIWRAMPSTVPLSSGSESRFRRIVEICYEAMGAKTTDPYRAIRAFVANEKRRLQEAAKIFE